MLDVMLMFFQDKLKLNTEETIKFINELDHPRDDNNTLKTLCNMYITTMNPAVLHEIKTYINEDIIND